MATQNGRLNTDLDGILTSAFTDGTKWYFFVKTQDGENETLGSIYDTVSENTVIGLLKGLKQQLPTALQNGFLKTQIMSSIPTGNNNIGRIDVDKLPALPTGTNKIGKVDIDKLIINEDGGLNVNIGDKTFTLSDGTNAVTINADGSLNIKPVGTVNVAVQNPQNDFYTSTGSLYGAVTIGATATPIRIGGTDLTGRHTIIIVNTSENDIFVGYDNAVTIENGLPIKAGQEREIKLNPTKTFTLYGIATADSIIRVVENK